VVVGCIEVLVIGCLHSFGLRGWIWCSLFAVVFYVGVAWYLVWHICLLDIYDIISALCGCRLLLVLLMGLVSSDGTGVDVLLRVFVRAVH